jgi:hypothetical protein
MMKVIPLIVFFVIVSLNLEAQLLNGFSPAGVYGEQQMLLEDSPHGTRILLHAPLDGFEKGSRVLLLFFALPNGNSIEWTTGKRLKKGDDWHYNIQHIGALIEPFYFDKLHSDLIFRSVKVDLNRHL